MARTVIAKTTPLGPFPGTVGAAALAATFTASGAGAGDQVALSGKTLLLFRNTDTNTHTVTISSVADVAGRTGDIGPYTLAIAGAANDIAAFVVDLSAPGWRQSDGNVYITCDSALVKIAAIALS